MKENSSKIHFFNKVIDKSELKNLITWAFRTYGIARASNMADRLKDLGFHYATKAGISLSLEDLRIPPSKQSLLKSTFKSIEETDRRYKRGEITAVERFQKVIDTWNYASDTLKREVIAYFKHTDPLNSIYMMAFSGARANISQVKQLVGMRGLMSDPQGQIIDLPIFHNFREGLTITDYFISSYGARKGLVDTALRTADSGYLTRRLVDVAQDIIVRDYDCKTSRGILIEEMIDNEKVLISLGQSLLGRVLAEDIIDFFSQKIIAKVNQCIDTNLLEKIEKLNLSNILIRSPLTCSSTRSICQLCYGWNLAHGKMVDLGEAVGIIAAQSIGEPGTQLTMRTFHTGGVFTGELSRHLVSEYSGFVCYPENINLIYSRNMYGDNVQLVKNDTFISIVTENNLKKQVFILKESLLLVKNSEYIEKGQAISEYPLNNKLSTEKAQKSVVADFAGSIHILKDTSFYKSNNSNSHSVVWILSGEVYNLPKISNLLISKGQFIQKNELLARTNLCNDIEGKIHIINNMNNKLVSPKVLLITSCKIYTNLIAVSEVVNDYKRYFLKTENNDKFLLKFPLNKKILDQQVIADLVSNAYKTKTGGIIKYLDLSISKILDQDTYNIENSGYILWIPEETHVVNKDISLLLVKNLSFIDVGTEIIQNIFASNTGFLEISEKDGIIRELVIKPGRLIKLNSNNIELDKYRGFLRPGEKLFNFITSDKLVYWEYLKISQNHFILLRPVIIYSLPSKNILLKFSDNSFATDFVDLKMVRRTFFKDGERIKSVSGVNLVFTHLILEIKKTIHNMKCYMQLQSNNSILNSSSFLIKFITADFLSIKESFFSKNYGLYSKTSILVKNGQHVESNSVICQTNIFSKISGEVAYVEETSSTNRRIMLIGDSNIAKIKFSPTCVSTVIPNSYIYSGDKIAEGINSSISGLVLSVDKEEIVIRIGQPYLISVGSLIHVTDTGLIQKGENIATLIFERLKTGDIVQGLPRIEEILEARKKVDTAFNPHFILEHKFRSYLSQGLSIYNASRLSILEIQLLLVKEVQSVYQSQGVYISDKHIEVIVKQMTSKVKIENGGNTNYLPGELIDLQKVEFVNNSLKLQLKQEASYYPVLLGITKASLNTESFISAASFQETTKVLTEAAIHGKIDQLRGLKENVIIGRLIPAGTGFSTYDFNKIDHDVYSKLRNSEEYQSNENKYLSANKTKEFDDIIIDDRIARTNNH
uniref:DNA-directed RNA polymerase subunit beta'' n=1 Tax=Polysiphonia sertularioides TaxID=945028 RepID=A0A1Z1M9R3_9FLOR|nr:RNA polymerase b''''-subunit [Polysiphonia sertularioides]ARW62484.1 RNA polymerase b''''-subunit [Polysiphonia sertularioides]